MKWNRRESRDEYISVKKQPNISKISIFWSQVKTIKVRFNLSKKKQQVYIDVLGIKTYFIAGRSKEFESISNRLALSDSESRSEPVAADPASSISQHASFRKVS